MWNYFHREHISAGDERIGVLIRVICLSREIFFISLGWTDIFCGQLFPIAPKTRKFNFDLKSVELTADNIKSFDAIVLSTDYDSFDYDLITRESKLIIDTRGRLKPSSTVFSA